MTIPMTPDMKRLREILEGVEGTTPGTLSYRAVIIDILKAFLADAPPDGAALREAQSVIDTMVLMMHGSPPTFFRRCNEVHATVNAALAKAEGGGG